jgi:hypothetical protein
MCKILSVKQFIILIISILPFIPVSSQTGDNNIAPVDTALLNIYKQLIIFPQEKIYIQTDKPYYVAGETVYYRLFLLDACFHAPFPVSRYVYVELIDQNGSVEVRQKLRPDEKGMYYNTIKLPKHLAQGYYKIRAYTRVMENTGAESFYSKPVFVIAENGEHLKMELNVSEKDKKHTSVELRFVNIQTDTVATPKNIFFQLNGKEQKVNNIRTDGVFAFDLPLTDNDRDRALYVEVLNEVDYVIFKQFDIVPYTSDSVKLSFYPEGGYIVEGQPNIIAFKALCKNGAPTDLTGNIVEADGTIIAKISARHEGMGIFCLAPESGKTYFVEYESNNKQYRIQLPDFKKNPFSLHTAWKNDKLWVSINRETGVVLPKMHLLVHCRGDIVYFDRWNSDRNALTFEKDLLRSGVNHIMFLSEDYQPLSERLVFCNKNDHIEPEIKPDKEKYKNREHAVINFSLDGIETFISKDTVQVDFSISVTSDRDVQIDTTTNILTQILLESELKGTISNPAYYFSEVPEVESNADLLMMTHGWTRYDIPKAMRGEFTVPLIEPETSQILKGQVKGGLIPRAASNIEVSVMSHRGKEKYYNVTKTDENGFFRFDNFELPDSSEFMIQVLKDKNKKKGLLEVVTETMEYPLAGDFGFTQYHVKTTNPFIEKTVAEIDWRYEYIDGIRVIRLPEVVVIGRWADKKPKHGNTLGIQPDFVITEEEIKESGINDVLMLISKFPYVTVNFRGWNSTVEVRALSVSGGIYPALIVVNGFQQVENEPPMSVLSLVNVNDIAEIHLTNTVAKTAEISSISGGSSPCIIEIITKTGLLYDRRLRFHFKSLMPLGYAVPAEFYSPKYDTPEAFQNDNPDLRSTIYWKPNIVIDSDNKASVDFYTADKDTPYSVVTEGICADGRLIYRREKELINVK